MAKYITLSEEATQLLCSLIRESHSVSEGINDSIVSDVSTFSSHRIQILMDALSEEDRKYAEDLVGNLKRLVTEVVDTIPTVDTAKTNTLYLYKDAGSTDNVYSQYMLINNEIITLGTTEVNLDGYYTSTDCDDKFATKVDLSGVTDAINEVKEYINDLKPYVELTQSEYDALSDEEKNNGTTYYIKDGVSGSGFLSIVNTIDSTATNEQVPSAKAVYDSLNSVSENLNDSLNKIGVITSKTLTTTTVSSSTNGTPLLDITLEKGKYLVIGHVRFSKNSEGVRSMSIHSTSGWNSSHAINNAIDGFPTVLHYSLIQNVGDTSVTLYLNVWQNSGVDLTCDAGYLQVIKLNS